MLTLTGSADIRLRRLLTEYFDDVEYDSYEGVDTNDLESEFQHDLATRNEAALANVDSVVARLVGKFDSAAGALLGIFSHSETCLESYCCPLTFVFDANQACIFSHPTFIAVAASALCQSGFRRPIGGRTPQLEP